MPQVLAPVLKFLRIAAKLLAQTNQRVAKAMWVVIRQFRLLKSLLKNPPY